MQQPLSHAAVAWPSGGMGYSHSPALFGRRYYSIDEWLQFHNASGSNPGLGDLNGLGATGTQLVQSAGSIASATLPAVTAATNATLFGLSAAMTSTVIGAAVAGVMLALMAIFSRKGPAQKVATTEIVNKIAPLWEQNLAAYMNGPRTVSSQAQALANFDAGWQYILDGCGRPEMGNPGKRCISERDRGGIYDGFAAWRDPIANDPNVRPDPVVDDVGNLIDTVTGGAFTSTTGGGVGWLFLAGLAVAGVFLIGGKK